MKIESSTPRRDGFRMPAEFEPHRGTVMIFPHRPGSWPHGAAAAQRAFCDIASLLSEREEVYMLAGPDVFERAAAMLDPAVKLLAIDSDDAWARDTAPTFLRDSRGNVRGVNWNFNAWGGSFDGLYTSWERDNALAAAFCEAAGFDYYDASPFVLEGGSICSDGEGTVITTLPCLGSPGRNPSLSKRQIEEKLREYLGAEKIIWLPHGIRGDETNEHVDNICAFISPGEVVLAWCDDRSDPQYGYSSACLEALEGERDAAGRKIRVHKLPIPDFPVLVRPDEIEGYDFEEGEDRREAGERLAASYVNFYFANGALLLPRFGGENAGADVRAAEIMSALCPGREIIALPSRDIILGGGNIHCITQQIPK